MTNHTPSTPCSFQRSVRFSWAFLFTLVMGIPSNVVWADECSRDDVNTLGTQTYTVYTWSCSRSLNEAGTFQSLDEACKFAAAAKATSRNVQVIQGQLKRPYDILGYSNAAKPTEYLVCDLHDVGEWRVVGRLKKAAHADLLAKSFQVEDDESISSFIVWRYESSQSDARE